jgi:myo-inositol-1(or 4)-monophosphatase
MTVNDDPSLSSLLSLGREAASVAGEALISLWEQVQAEGAEETKSGPTDLVSRADRAAQEVTEGLISEARPGDAIFGEEGLERPGVTGWRWVLDPLDGSTNYLLGFGDWAVSVAVEDPAGITVAGVVLAPARGHTWTAVLGQGVQLNGRAVTVRDCTDLAETVVGTGFSYDAEIRALQGAVLARLLPDVADIRRSGSAALDLCAVASGWTGAFYENDLKKWDWAAGGLIAAEAGAVVAPLPGPAGRSGIIAAAPAIAAPLALAVGSPARVPDRQRSGRR